MNYVLKLVLTWRLLQPLICKYSNLVIKRIYQSVMLGGGGQFGKQQVIENNQTNKSQLSPVDFWKECVWRDAFAHEICKEEAKETHKHTHTLKTGDPYYKPKTQKDAKRKKEKKETTHTLLCMQAVKSRSWVNPCSMLFLQGEWGVRWLRHEGSSPNCHSYPCAGRTEIN